jgi:heme A synthase
MAVVLYAWWATRLETFTAESTGAVVGSGAAAMAWGTWRRMRSDPAAATKDGPGSVAGRDRRSTVWLMLLAALAVWQMQAFLQSPREDHPTISSITNSALETETARTAVCAAWILGAYRLARRVPYPVPLSRPNTEREVAT